jgi:putative ABC transport system substrate-binding protein
MNKIIILAGGVLAVAGLLFYFSTLTPKAATLQKQHVTIGVLSSQSNASYEVMLATVKEKLALLSDRYTITYIQEPDLKKETFGAAAQKYVNQRVDIILANSTTAVLPAMSHTATIPIVYGSIGDPVGSKIAASMDSSGNNTTGVTSLAVDLTPRRLEILLKTFPHTKKVYFIHEPGAITSDAAKAKTEARAKELGVTLVEKGVFTATDVANVARELKKSEADAILMSASSLIWAQLPYLVEAQRREKIPLVGTDKSMIAGGAAFSYGPDYVAMGEQVGEIVALVIKGLKPADIPIQVAKKIEFILNSQVLEEVGLTPTPEAYESADLIIQ